MANYFNAEAGDSMQVVSWTGDEIEFYNGVNLSRSVVNSAFKLPPEPSVLARGFSSLSGSGSGNYDSGVKFVLKAVGVLVLFFIIFGRGLSRSTDYEASPVKRIFAGPPPLAVGAVGKWHDQNYHITAHAVVEVAQVGLIFDRHEYELTDDAGMKALLVCGDQPDAGNWIFSEQFFPLLPPTPTARQMAAKTVGDTVELDGFSDKVSGIFRSTVGQADGDWQAGLKTGTVLYGLAGTNEFNFLLARWNGESFSFYRGRSQLAKKFTAGFAAEK